MAASSKSNQDRALALYEKALKLLYGKKFKEAEKTLTQIQTKFPGELELLARVEPLLRICQARQRAADPAQVGAEELYTSGLVEHNEGNYDDALAYFQQALKKADSDGDYIHFAMAASESRRGNADSALKHLKRALELNPENRVLAKRDPDFEPLFGEDGFRKLVLEGD